MKNLKLPLKQSAGYIYDASGLLVARVFDSHLKTFEVNDVADSFISLANGFYPNIETIRDLSQSIRDMEKMIDNLSDNRERHPLEFAIEQAHKACKKLFTQTKVLKVLHESITA